MAHDITQPLRWLAGKAVVCRRILIGGNLLISFLSMWALFSRVTVLPLPTPVYSFQFFEVISRNDSAKFSSSFTVHYTG